MTSAPIFGDSIPAWGSCDPTLNGFQSISETDYVLGPSGEQAAEVAMDANNTMAWAHTNAWAGGKLLATYDPTGLHFYLNDPLGTRRVQTDYEGVVEQTCSSLPFGDGLNCTGSSQYPTEHHFTGKERDSESGNDYFGARYYASSMGRFLSPDDGSDQDSGDPQSWNLYSYVRNNPLGGVDEDGHQVTVCSNVTNGDGSTGQSCNTISDDEYKAGVAAQKAADANNPPYAGFSAPGGDRPNGNITDNGQVVGTATWSANPVPDQGQVIPGDMGLSLVAGGMATDFVVGKVVGAIGNMLGSGAVDVAVRGGIGPVLKGAAGVDRAVAEIEAEGGQVVAKEVTIVTPAGRARVDIVYKDSSGNLVLGEAKNGPTAGLNPNQQAVYQAAQSGGARFVGGNASNAGLSGSIGPTQVRIFKY